MKRKAAASWLLATAHLCGAPSWLTGCEGSTTHSSRDASLDIDASLGDAGVLRDAYMAPPDARYARDASRDAMQVAPSDGGLPTQLTCNGSVDLCARPYDQVVFPAAHNAHAAEEYGYGALNANQLSGFAKQLEDGVRAFLMDVYKDSGDHVFCHAYCALGKTSHQAGLTIFKNFLSTHPREVITFIYQDELSAREIAQDFEETGLARYVHTQAPGAPWPTLQQLIDAGTPLVVTAEHGRQPPSWFHHAWDVAWDTPYDFRKASDFSCALNRGAKHNALFLVNHWLHNAAGLPNKQAAKQVNAYEVLFERVQKCADETGDIPNFVAVDFYEYGDLFKVVAAMNKRLP